MPPHYHFNPSLSQSPVPLHSIIPRRPRIAASPRHPARPSAQRRGKRSSSSSAAAAAVHRRETGGGAPVSPFCIAPPPHFSFPIPTSKRRRHTGTEGGGCGRARRRTGGWGRRHTSSRKVADDSARRPQATAHGIPAPLPKTLKFHPHLFPSNLHDFSVIHWIFLLISCYYAMLKREMIRSGNLSFMCVKYQTWEVETNYLVSLFLFSDVQTSVHWTFIWNFQTMVLLNKQAAVQIEYCQFYCQPTARSDKFRRISIVVDLNTLIDRYNHTSASSCILFCSEFALTLIMWRIKRWNMEN